MQNRQPHTYVLAIAYRDSGQYEDAIVQAKKATEQEPNDLISWACLASALSLGGHEEEARAAAKRYCDALRRAGLPE